MDYRNTKDWPEIEVLAREVRSVLSDQGKRVFDVLWPHPPRGSKAVWAALSKFIPNITAEKTTSAVFKIRRRITDFSESSAGISRKYRLSLAEGARNKA